GDKSEGVALVRCASSAFPTLPTLDWALRFVNQARTATGQAAEPLRLEDIPLDDATSYKIFSSANAPAVFQFESRGMRDLLKKAKPDRFEDIIALVALYRPGPM